MNEKIKTWLICAAGIYGVIMFAAIVVYFMMPFVVPQEELSSEAAQVAAADEENKQLTEEEQIKAALAAAKEEEEKKKKKEPSEEEKKTAREKAEEKREKIREENKKIWGNDKTFRELTAPMKETVRGNVTFYTHDYSNTPPSGVYIRPFVIKGHSDAILKNDVYYYVTLEDADFNWVNGDTVTINADGRTITWHFDPAKRRGKFGKGAESLFESYVETAPASRIADLKAIGDAKNVTVTYSGKEGRSRTTPMSRENIRHVRDMVKLYELFNNEAAGKEKQK